MEELHKYNCGNPSPIKRIYENNVEKCSDGGYHLYDFPEQDVLHSHQDTIEDMEAVIASSDDHADSWAIIYKRHKERTVDGVRYLNEVIVKRVIIEN